MMGDLTNGGLGDQTTWVGYIDPGVIENSFRATPTFTGIVSTDDITNDSSFLIAQPTVIGLSSNNGATNAGLHISLDDGVVLKGKDDLTTSVLANFENDSGDELMQIKNDGKFTQTRGDFQIKNSPTAYLGIIPAVGTQYENGDDYFFTGVVDATGFGSSVQSSVAYRNALTTKAYFATIGATSATIGFNNQTTTEGVTATFSESNGIVMRGKDDSSGTQGFLIEGDSGADLLGLKNNGFLESAASFSGSVSRGLAVNTSILGSGVEGSVFYSTDGTNINFSGIAEFTPGQDSSVLYYGDGTATNYMLVNSSGYGALVDNGSVSLGFTGTLTDGFGFRGKDDSSSTTNFLVKNNSEDPLLRIKNDGNLEAIRSTTEGSFSFGNFDYSHPVFGSIPMSGSAFTFSANESFDNGIFDVGGTYGSGQHYLNTTTNEYIGFDVTNNDAGFFNFNLATNSAVTITANNDNLMMAASPNGVIGNRIEINNDTTGTIFTSLDDLGTSTLVNFENNSGTDLVTISNSGNFGIGDVTPDFALDVEDSSPTYIASIFNDGNLLTRRGLWIQAGLDDQSQAGPNILIGFGDGDGTAVGSITFGSSATAYNTSSDRRLKENIVDTSLSIDVLNQIKIRDFTWIADMNHTLAHGVIAQELYDVYPGAVTKPEDESVDTWMVDYSKLVPLAVKAIQDLDLKITSIQTIETSGSFANRLREFFADSTNGIGDFFANRVHTKTICLSDDAGDETCITKENLDTLLQQGGSGSVSGSSGDSGTSGNADDSTGTTGGDTSDGTTTGDADTPPVE